MHDSSFQHYIPKSPLSDYVKLFWYWNQNNPAPVKERILPFGTVEFVIRLTTDRTRIFLPGDLQRAKGCSGAVITGPQSKFFVLDKSDQDELLGVHFNPGGSFPFFGAPADEFLNQHVSLDEAWGPAAADHLRSELLEAPTVQAKFSILEKRLLERSARPLTRHRAVAFAMAELKRGPHGKSLAAIASEVNLSSKRLAQVFSRETGLTPKLFARVQRFQLAIHAMRGKKTMDWLNLALDCGYYDQAHFNHDFSEFSGINPSLYLTKQTEHLGHVEF
jgi:AraC-like DNA-binding protein